MSERDDITRGLRQLLELDRAFGIEFLPRVETPAVSVRRPAESPAPGPVAAAQEALASSEPLLPAAALAAIAREVAACKRCGLCSGRTNTVPGEGDAAARLVFVGEGPGADEDAQGRPFAGPAGDLLTKMIAAMGLAREQVFLTNVVKCRPPDERQPDASEAAACLPFLERQLLAIRPTVICTLGNTPLRTLMGDPKLGIISMRGKRLVWKGIPLIPTFHPSYLLRNTPAKKPCWEDLKVVMQLLKEHTDG